MRGKLILSLLLCALFFVSFASAAYLDQYDFNNIRILVNYSDDVNVYQTSLFKSTGEEYGLWQELPIGSIQFDRYYRFRPTDPGINNGPTLPLVPGRYVLNLLGVDQNNNPLTDTFEFDILGIKITLIEPPLGLSTTSTFDVVFKTSEKGADVLAECRWNRINSTNFDISSPTDEGSTLSTLHTISDYHWKGNLFIICKEISGRITPASFYVGWDDTPPNLTLTVIPTIVNDEDNKWAVIRAQTDDDTTCTIDGVNFPGEDPNNPNAYTTFHEVKVWYNTITDTIRHDFEYDIACRNKAALSTTKKANVMVDFSFSSAIEVLEPDADIDRFDFTLIVLPSFTADFCTVNGDDMNAISGGRFDADFDAPEIREGDNPFDIHCEGPLGNASRLYVVNVNNVTPPGGCTSSAQCPATYACVNGVCKAPSNTSCSSDSDCPTGEICVSGQCEFPNYGCTSSSQCATGYACISGICRPPSNQTCGSNSDCPTGEICVSGNCEFPVTGCTSPFDCPDLSYICVSSACIPPSGQTCTTNSDCPESLEICDSGICVFPDILGGSNASCTSNSDCPSIYEVCVDGKCTLPGPTGPSCTTSFDCPNFDETCIDGKCVRSGSPPGPACTLSSDCPDFNDICVNGRCVDRGDNRTGPGPGTNLPEDKKTDWLAIILIILGLLIMGGSGYYLYYENEQKREQRSRQAQKPTYPPPGRADPAQAALIEKALADREKKMAAVQQQREQDKKAKSKARHATFGTFSGDDGKMKATRKSGKKSKKDDPFVQLSSVGKKKTAKKRPRKKDDSAFDELEKIGK